MRNQIKTDFVVIKFGKSLTQHEQNLIAFERKRLILYLSMLCNKKIWLIFIPKKGFAVESGIVTSIVNEQSRSLMGGSFCLNKAQSYQIGDVYGASFEPIDLNSEEFKCQWVTMFNASVMGNEAEVKGCILFAETDLKPQDFSTRSPLDLVHLDLGNIEAMRKFNDRYYRLIASMLTR